MNRKKKISHFIFKIERLKRITAINVNPFLTKIDFHVARNTKILTFPDSDPRFPDYS